MATYGGLVRAAYALELDESEWVANLARELSEALGRDSAAYTIFPDKVGRDRLRALASVGAWTSVLEDAVAIQAEFPASHFRSLYGPAPFVGLWSSQAREIRRRLGPDESWFEGLEARMRQTFEHDVIGIYGGNASGGVMLCAPTTEPLSPRTRWALSRVAAHLAAAFRLRGAGMRDPDALLDAEGRILEGRVDASPSTLARAAGEYRLAQQPGVEAIDVWRGLVDGRWSLVRSVRQDGRTHLILRVNEIEDARGDDVATRRATSILALAARGHTNKFIAYELGLPISTVASDLRRSLASLGLTRVELARLSEEERAPTSE